MKRRTKILLVAGGILLLGGLVAANLKFDRTRRVEVQVERLGRHDLESIVSASGRIEAKRRVNVSANTMGKITRLAVEEGDRVRKGDFLLEIDPTPFRASVAALEAALRAAEAGLERERANREKSDADLRRLEDLFRRNLVPEEQLDAARTAQSVTRAQEEAAREEVLRRRAELQNARHDLDQVTIHAELSGVVTRLNVEEGENVVTGTMNNPGTVLLTIADLSEIEAEIDVDETDVVDLRIGQAAKVSIDAFPDRTFAGAVSRIGHSAVSTASGSGPQAVNFRVTVTLNEEVPDVRPGLTCTADITVATREAALAVPIQAVTVREPPAPETPPAPPGEAAAAAPEPPENREEDGEEKEVEGVFLVVDGAARFRPVKLGVSGER
ncbi:MAG: efflux RND transporter periplasmic adaptor subunit, partial [Acidobacteria bacterium]|nr:efflux RND transporter periplasmic adaptor subunit [Acidobacteriota bacterium]